MLDELCEQIVDELCEWIPAYFRPRLIKLANSPLGFRVTLYVGTAVRHIATLISSFRSEESIEALMNDVSQRVSAWMERWRGRFHFYMQVGDRFGLFCRKARFGAAFLLMLVAALGVLATGDRQISVCAASLCLLWLSIAMEIEYEPVCGRIRQRYLASMLLRGASMLPLLFDFFTRYLRLYVSNNVILQSAMLIAIFVHLAFYVPLIALNTRQNPLLRALSGVLGMIPALTAAAAVAAVASTMPLSADAKMAALLSAAGALLAFAGYITDSVIALGAIRLRWQDIYRFMFTTGGYALMLAGAFTQAAL